MAQRSCETCGTLDDGWKRACIDCMGCRTEHLPAWHPTLATMQAGESALSAYLNGPDNGSDFKPRSE